MNSFSEKVVSVARLAKLALTVDEINRFGPQLDSIIQYIDTLQELDTTKVMPTRQVTGLSNVTRPDAVLTSLLPDQLLDCSPLPQESHHLVVPSVFA